VTALSVKFWGRFLALARRAVPSATFPDMPRDQKWGLGAKVVDHVGDVLDGLTARAMSKQHGFVLHDRWNRDDEFEKRFASAHE
jgi:hypothetical protein